MAAFSYAVKTEKSREYFTVIGSGTKKMMLKMASIFDNMPQTIESKITRDKDGKVVYRYTRYYID